MILKKVKEKSAAAENIKLVIYDRLSCPLLPCIISEKEGNVNLIPNLFVYPFKEISFIPSTVQKLENALIMFIL